MKLLKKIPLVITIAALIFTQPANLTASTDIISSRIQDNADYLTDAEEADISELLNTIADTYGYDLSIISDKEVTDYYTWWDKYADVIRYGSPRTVVVISDAGIIPINILGTPYTINEYTTTIYFSLLSSGNINTIHKLLKLYLLICIDFLAAGSEGTPYSEDNPYTKTLSDLGLGETHEVDSSERELAHLIAKILGLYMIVGLAAFFPVVILLFIFSSIEFKTSVKNAESLKHYIKDIHVTRIADSQTYINHFG